jgi:toxin ParE1/3/4
MTEAKDYRLHPLAWREVEAADDWYFSHSFDASVAFLGDLQSALASVSQAPQRWPKYLYGTRRIVMQRFPFSVVFLDEPDLVIIVAIAHSKRRPGYWKDRV